MTLAIQGTHDNPDTELNPFCKALTNAGLRVLDGRQNREMKEFSPTESGLRVLNDCEPWAGTRWNDSCMVHGTAHRGWDVMRSQ